MMPMGAMAGSAVPVAQVKMILQTTVNKLTIGTKYNINFFNT